MMHQCGALVTMAQLAFAKDLPDAIRAESLYTLGDMIRDSETNRDAFAKAVGRDAANADIYGAQMLAVTAVGQTGVRDVRARLAAAYAFEVGLKCIGTTQLC
jgi:hypothetical protein